MAILVLLNLLSQAKLQRLHTQCVVLHQKIVDKTLKVNYNVNQKASKL